jgi:hypothetical protein
MNSFFVMALQRITITEPLGAGLELPHGLLLAPDSRFLGGLLLSPEFVRLIGLLEADALSSAPALLYREFTEPFTEDQSALKVLNNQLDLAHVLMLSLWFVKDNAVGFDLGFLAQPETEDGWKVSSNFKHAQHLTADASRDNVAFSLKDLENARRVFSAFTHDYPRNYSDTPMTSPRINRAISLLEQARDTCTLDLRLAQYVTALEALFATSTTELSHRLSERVAVFLARDSKTRHAVYDTVHSAYGLRSTVLHGARLKPKAVEALGQLATELDNFLRVSLGRILTDDRLTELFGGGPEALDDYFLEDLLRGATGTPA